MKRHFAIFWLIFLFCPLHFFAQNLIVKYKNYDEPPSQEYSSFLIINEAESYYIGIYHKSFADFQELLEDKEYCESFIYTSSNYKNLAKNNELFAVASL